jgi:hypothetical protein
MSKEKNNPEENDHFKLDRNYTVAELLAISKEDIEKLKLIKEITVRKKKRPVDYLVDASIPILLVILSGISTYIFTSYNIETDRLTEDKRYVRELDKLIHSNASPEVKAELAESMLIFDSVYNNEDDPEIALILRRDSVFLAEYRKTTEAQKNKAQFVSEHRELAIIEKENLHEIDSIEAVINNKKLNKKYSKSVQDIKTDSLQLAKIVRNVQQLDTVKNIENNTRQQILLLNHPSVVPTRAEHENILWVKAGYYLLFFEHIRIDLESIDDLNRRITVSIYRVDPDDPKKILETVTEHVVVSTEKPLSFANQAHHYELKLHGIGPAGRNPFAPAAFVTCVRQ